MPPVPTRWLQMPGGPAGCRRPASYAGLRSSGNAFAAQPLPVARPRPSLRPARRLRLRPFTQQFSFWLFRCVRRSSPDRGRPALDGFPGSFRGQDALGPTKWELLPFTPSPVHALALTTNYAAAKIRRPKGRHRLPFRGGRKHHPRGKRNQIRGLHEGTGTGEARR